MTSKVTPGKLLFLNYLMIEFPLQFDRHLVCPVALQSQDRVADVALYRELQICVIAVDRLQVANRCFCKRRTRIMFIYRMYFSWLQKMIVKFNLLWSEFVETNE